MKSPVALHRLVLALWSVLGPASAWAAITWTGDIEPGDPTTWTSLTSGAVGKTAEGAVAVDGGSELISSLTRLGDKSGSTGEVTVTGFDSKWSNSGSLYIGEYGDGSLDIQTGGIVSSQIGNLGNYSGSSGEATVFGAGSQWINSLNLSVGIRGRGTLNIVAGGTVTNFGGFLGSAQGSMGETTVSGTNSRWINSGTLFVGLEGTGTLRVEDEGNVTAATLYASLADLHGNGTVSATSGAVLDGDLLFDATHGTESVLSFGTGGVLTVATNGGPLGAGYKATGRLTIADGIAANSSSGTLGYYLGSSGDATVIGMGSQWNNSSQFSVGSRGNGRLNILAGGTVTNDDTGYIGSQPGSVGEATVSGTGSQWSNAGAFYVGRYGNGTLDILSGGKVTNRLGYLGNYADSTGEVTVSGIGSQWINDLNLRVGNEGRGSLNVLAGGSVTNSVGYLGYSSSSKGVVTISGTGSQLRNVGSLYVGRAGEGTLDIHAGGTVSNSKGHLGALSDATGEAMVSGLGSRWDSYGELRVGDQGSGKLTISNGGLASVAGVLSIDVDANGDSLVNMATGGMLALKSGASADDSLADFLALVGGTKAIRYWDDALADWADITTATYGDDYTLEYLTSGDLAGYTLLTVGQLPALPGDYNADGVVDAADYTVWRDNLGQSVTLPNQATPGSVTQYDHDVWAANYGATLAAEPIPEPNALALAAFALGLCTARRVAD